MRIKPITASVLGPTNEKHWGQVLQTPTSYAVIETQTVDGIASQRGIQILTHLASALNQVSAVSLKQLENLADETIKEDLVTLMILVPVGKVLYLVMRGAGAIYLKRQKQIAALLTGNGALSGEVQVGDDLLCASAGFTKTLSVSQLTEVFDHLSPPEVAEKLTLLLHEAANGEGGAALIYQVAEMVDAQEAPLQETTVSIAQPYVSQAKRPHEQVLSFWKKVQKFKHFSIRPAAVVAAIMVLLFLVSVVLGVSKQMGRAKNQTFTKTLTEVQHISDEGMALLDLNVVKGREKLTQAKTMLEPLIKTVSPRSKEGRQLTSLYLQITDNLSRAMHIVKTSPELFYDVSLIKKDATATTISLFENTLGIADERGKTVYQLDLASKSAKIIAGGDVYQGLKSMAVYATKYYNLADGGIILATTSDKTGGEIIKKSPEWGKITHLVAFSGNLYLLDTQKSRIWKYVATEGGFSQLFEYLNPDTLPDLSLATSMAIDGSVWLGTSNGKIWRFTQGKENTFMASGVEPALGNNLLVYTSDETNNLYVLDQDNKRVVVLAKDGVYLSQYVWESNLSPAQLVVNEQQKKILLLSEGKIFSLTLE